MKASVKNGLETAEKREKIWHFDHGNPALTLRSAVRKDNAQVPLSGAYNRDRKKGSFEKSQGKGRRHGLFGEGNVTIWRNICTEDVLMAPWWNIL